MAKHIHKCNSCSLYTMEEKCPSCNSDTILPKPAKFSLQDKYADLTREVKKKGLQERGLY
jgi:H/ACA ribonucleoprotein complex subunit 3